MNQKICVAAACSAILICTPAFSEVLRLQPDFTNKRVTVPSANTTSRITVQIDPDAPRLEPIYADPAPEQVSVAPDGSIALPPPSGLEWFWMAVSPALQDQSSARLTQALEQINNPPSGKAVRAPRLQTLQTIANQHGIDILRETVGTSVSPALVLAIISVESAGQPEAISSAGAVGLMQLMPATAERFGVTDRNDPAQNIKGGVTYLTWLLKRFGNDPILALAGYNAGEGNVERHEGVPPFAETRAYVPKVLAAWQVANGLCQTPPELITDDCVFNVNGI